MTATISSPVVVAPRRSSKPAAAARVLAPGEGQAYWVLGDRLTFKLGAKDTGGALSMAEAWIVPGGGPPPHVHHREDEMFYLLDGRLQFVLGEELIDAGPGDALFLPRGVPHTFKNASSVPARAVVFAMPCGFENFIPEFATPVEQSPEAPPVTQEVIDRLLGACPRFGLEMKFDHQPRNATPVAPKKLHKPLWVLGEHVDQKLASRDTAGAYNVATITTRPGGGPPSHVHTDCDEIFYVEAGRYEFLVGDRTIVGHAGTTVYVPSGTMHRFKNVGLAKARLLAIHTPGGFENFYNEMGTECTDPARPPTEPLDLARVMTITKKHHMILAT
jgi:mannose-6-phosphate isomerase-like protein (cupin superfamily)